MKVAVVIDALNGGGSERQALLSVAALHRAGVEAELVCYRRSGFDYAELAESLDVTPNICLSGDYLPARLAFLHRCLRRRPVDVVHAFKGRASLTAYLPAKAAGTPVFLAGYRDLKVPPWQLSLAYRYLSKAAHGWIVNSRAIRDHVVAHFGVPECQVNIVSNAVWGTSVYSQLTEKTAKARFGISADSLTVTCLGRLRPDKNQDLFLAMATRVALQLENVEFVVAGDGPEEAALRKAAKTRGIGKRVQFLGRVHDVADVLRATDILVLTSNREGFPNVLLEAAHCGIACVSTSNGGGSEIIDNGKTGFIVSHDERELSERVLELLTDSRKRQLFGQMAQFGVNGRFTLEALGEQLICAYQSFLQQPVKPGTMIGAGLRT